MNGVSKFLSFTSHVVMRVHTICVDVVCDICLSIVHTICNKMKLLYM